MHPPGTAFFDVLREKLKWGPLTVTMKKWSSATAIIIAVIAGAIFGAVLPSAGASLAIFGDIFLKLIQSVVAPLMFASLVVGVARAGSGATMGRVGGKALLLFQVTATLSLVVGVAAAVIAKPGASEFRSLAMHRLCRKMPQVFMTSS